MLDLAWLLGTYLLLILWPGWKLSLTGYVNAVN